MFLMLILSLFLRVILQPGTYLYHAHYGMLRDAGVYGSIRVSLPDGKSEPFDYDYDRSIILNDWYHKSTHDLATGLSSLPFAWVGEPQVINCPFFFFSGLL